MKKNNIVNQPAQQLAASLVKRGFLLEVEGDRIILSAGNGPQDLDDLKHLLGHAGVPVCYSGHQLQILSPMMPTEILTMIERLPVQYGRSFIPNHFHSWRAFTKRNHGVRWNSLSLDRGIALLVKSISASGILVTGGCDGHRRKAPQVYFASGWSAAWFHILQHQYLKFTGFHYEWKVVVDHDASPRLQAVLGDHQKWTIAMIQRDALMISQVMQEAAPQLRTMKRQLFKNRSMRKEAERFENNFEYLCQWMSDIAIKGGMFL